MNRDVVAVRGWDWQQRQAKSVTHDVSGTITCASSVTAALKTAD